MKARKYFLWILLTAYAILWCGGIGSYLFFTQPPPEAEWAAPTFLLLAGLIVLFASDLKASGYLLFSGIVGFSAEILGIHTGFPFGRYYYTATIQPAVLHVPLVMMTAWIILPAYVRQVLPAKMRAVPFLFTGALLMVIIDLLVDPVAIGPMKLWIWVDTGFYYTIPTSNFIGWFFISAIIFSFLYKIPHLSLWHLYIGSSVILFFTIISFAEGLTYAGYAGVFTLFLQWVIKSRPVLKTKGTKGKSNPADQEHSFIQ